MAAGWRRRQSVDRREVWEAAVEKERATETARSQAAEKDWKAALSRREAQEKQRALDPRVLSGEAARERRDREWALRVAQDPSLAVSALEQRLVQLRALGQSPQLSDSQALVEVARLASPRGSRLEVVPEGDGYLLRVAFSMAALAPNEGGASTEHRSVLALKRDVREGSARLLRDILGAGDNRRVQRVTVSCNRAIRHRLIPAAATPEERAQLLSRAKVQLRRIYRVAVDRQQIASVTDWRTVSLDHVLELMRVEHDELNDLMIEAVGNLDPWKVDPDQPLEF